MGRTKRTARKSTGKLAAKQAKMEPEAKTEASRVEQWAAKIAEALAEPTKRFVEEHAIELDLTQNPNEDPQWKGKAKDEGGPSSSKHKLPEEETEEEKQAWMAKHKIRFVEPGEECSVPRVNLAWPQEIDAKADKLTCYQCGAYHGRYTPNALAMHLGAVHKVPKFLEFYEAIVKDQQTFHVEDGARYFDSITAIGPPALEENAKHEETWKGAVEENAKYRKCWEETHFDAQELRVPH